MQASPDGRIVDVSSMWGLLGLFNNEELKDVENLTDEKLDEVLAKFLKDFEDGSVESHGWPITFSAYKVATAAMNAYSRKLARRHPELRVNCAHPGFVKTDITRNSGLLSPAEGAGHVTKVGLRPLGGPTGAYFTLGEVVPFVWCTIPAAHSPSLLAPSLFRSATVCYQSSSAQVYNLKNYEVP